MKELNCQQRLQERGGQKILAGKPHIIKLPEQSKAGNLFVNHALGVEKQSLLHIMKTMTNHLMLCGSASLATNNVTKN